MHGKLGRNAGQPLDQVTAAQQDASDQVAAVGLAELRRGEIQGNAHPRPEQARYPAPLYRLHQEPQHLLRLSVISETPNPPSSPSPVDSFRSASSRRSAA